MDPLPAWFGFIYMIGMTPKHSQPRIANENKVSSSTLIVQSSLMERPIYLFLIPALASPCGSSSDTPAPRTQLLHPNQHSTAYNTLPLQSVAMDPTHSSDNPGQEPRPNSAPQGGPAAHEDQNVQATELRIPVLYHHGRDEPEYVITPRAFSDENGRMVFDNHGATVHARSGGVIRVDYDRRGYLAAYRPVQLVSTKGVFIWGDKVFAHGNIYDLFEDSIDELVHIGTRAGREVRVANDAQRELFDLVELFNRVHLDYVLFRQVTIFGLRRIKAKAPRCPPRIREELEGMVRDIVDRITENMHVVATVMAAAFPEDGYIRPRGDLEYAAEHLESVDNELTRLFDAYSLARDASMQYQATLENQFARAA